MTLGRRTRVAITSVESAPGVPLWDSNQIITDIPEGKTEASFENLIAGRRYYTKTWNEDAFGNASEEVIRVVDVPPDLTIPDAPTGLTLNAGSYGFQAQWDEVTDVDLADYEVQYAPDDGSHTGPGGNPTWVSVITKTNRLWIESEVGVTQWVRVGARDFTGNISPFSDMAETTPFRLVPLLFGGPGFFDSDSPCYVYFKVPDEVTSVAKVEVTLAFRQFFANARDAASSGTLTSDSGGGSTTPSGGGSTSGASSASSAGSTNLTVFLAGSSAHSHTDPQGGSTGTTAPLGDVISSISDHSHTIAHTHSTPSHTHSTPDHDHTVPGHTHDLTYGTFEETYPVSHAVKVKTYLRAGGAWVLQDTINDLILDLEDIDLTTVVTGPGDWRITVQSQAGEPNNGRLGVDIFGSITAVFGGPDIFSTETVPGATYVSGSLWIGGVEVFDEDGNLMVGAPPSGAAGGDLSGTYPNPSVVDDSHAHSSTSVTTHSTAHSHASLTGVGATDHHAAPAAGPDADVTIDAAGAAGTASTFARSAHGHKLVTSAVAASAVGTAAAGTSGTAPSRGDHVHSATHGALTGVGANDHHAQAHAADHAPGGADAVISVVAPTTIAFGDAAASGAAAQGARRDHVHGMPANPVTAHEAAGDPHTAYALDSDLTTHAGAADPHTGYRLESADHTHASSGLQAGQVAHSALTGISATDHHAAPAAGPDADITIDAAGAAGTASTFARSAHGHKLSTSATAAVAIGTAAPGTSGHSPSRDDHVHPTGAGTPSTQAFGDAAATGTGPAAAMTDHKHAMPTGTAGPDADITIDAAGAAGTANTAARSAHGHKLATSASAPLDVDATAAAAGTSGHAPSRDDHRHKLGAHGATEHTNITRKFYLAAEDGTLNAGTFVSLGASPDQTRAIALADAATQGAFWNFMVPGDWDSGGLTVTPVWSPGASDAVAHTVRWSMTAKKMDAGSTVTAAGTATAFTGASAARTLGVLVYDTATSMAVTPAAAGDLQRIGIRRLGADAADTYVGTVNLIGLIVSYTANQ